MAADDDETVRLPVRRKVPGTRPTSRRLFISCALCAGAAAAGGAAWWRWGHHPPPPLTAAITPPEPRQEPPPPPETKTPLPVIAIAVADEATILGNQPADLDVFRFDRNDRLLVLDFARLARQGAMLNRVAAMIEKNGDPHDRALGDAELDQVIRAGGDTPDTFYFGHDYGTVELARFFSATDRQQMVLSPDETWLRRLIDQEAAARPGPLGLISIPAVASNVTPEMRRTILHHELSHGEYFTNPAYADWTHDFWNRVLDGPTRMAFQSFLVSENYDPALKDLLANETQAYLMFTASPRFFRPDLVGMDLAALDALRARFRAGMPPGWLRDQALREAHI